jgi:predicted nucleic acid-binding protein
VHWAILDSNVYIGHWERGLYHADLERIRQAFVIRHSAVVLSELRRGARTRAAQKLVDRLYRLAAVQWEPIAADWWRAGLLIRRIGDRKGWTKNKRRDFQNDVLIGLTARRYGATVVTANLSDFALLSRELGISVLPVV